MTTTTTQAMNAAQEAQDRITALEAERVHLQENSGALSTRVAEIGMLSGKLKMRFARGDASAGTALEKLDRELLEINHRRDGLCLSLDDLEKTMAPLHRIARERAEAADVERQDREVSEFAKMSQQRTDAIIAQWRGACRDAFDLMWMVEQAVTSGRNLDETHRSQILSKLEQINNRFVRESTAVVNEGWKFCRADQFRSLAIVPARKAG
jgi:hypothetical protein